MEHHFAIASGRIRPAGKVVLGTGEESDQGVKKLSHQLNRVDRQKSAQLRRFLFLRLLINGLFILPLCSMARIAGKPRVSPRPYCRHEKPAGEGRRAHFSGLEAVSRAR
jgi:hypothetical protein